MHNTYCHKILLIAQNFHKFAPNSIRNQEKMVLRIYNIKYCESELTKPENMSRGFGNTLGASRIRPVSLKFLGESIFKRKMHESEIFKFN